MVYNKRKKNSRQRGSMTHGWGAKKKHRGAGNRGGRGMAGTGKRADQRKPSIWTNPLYFGKHGFKKKNIPVIINAINIGDLNELALRLVAQGKAKKTKDHIEITLADLGYNKVLSAGTIQHKLRIITPFASEKVQSKLQEAGGELVITQKKRADQLHQTQPKSLK